MEAWAVELRRIIDDKPEETEQPQQQRLAA
jgi:hypothetical protein